MNKCCFTLLCSLAVLPTLGRAEDVPTPQRVEQLVREFAFSSKPNLNTNTEFSISRFDVKDLWEAMQVEVLDIQYMIHGQSFNGFVGLYHDGKIILLAPNFGGYGLMSGMVSKGEFYYTYSFGSGIHRSHVAKLQVHDGRLKHWDSDGFQATDLFVSGGSDGKVHVLSGKFNYFNHWETAKDIGTIAEGNSPTIQIIDPNGKVVVSTFPSPKPKESSLSSGSTNGTQPIHPTTNTNGSPR